MARASALLFPLAGRLLERDRWPDRATVARALGVAPGTIQGWMNHLTHHRAVRPADGLRVDRARLLTVLAAHRIASQRPERPFPCSLSPSEIHARLVAAQVPHAFCMFTAANQWAFFEPRGAVQLYVPQRHRAKLARELRTSRGDVLHPFVETVEALPVVTRGGLPVTDLLLTLADLRAHPEGGAHAAFLEPHLAGAEP